MKNLQILIGHLGNNPETHTFDNGDKITKFAVATSDKWTDKTTGEKKERTEWHTIITQKAIANSVEKYLKKGSKVYIEGVTRHRSYEHEGIKKYITEVKCNNLIFLDSNTTNSNPGATKPTSKEPDDLPF